MNRHSAMAWAVASVLTTAAAEGQAPQPQWWVRRGVVNTNATPNDYAAVVEGQAKWFAAQACAEFNDMLAELGGAGDSVADMVTGLVPSESDYTAVNVGQIKCLAQPFYDRIAEAVALDPGITNALPVGMAGVYPWSETADDDADGALANIGQLKCAFAFDFDRDRNGMADWWELRHFGAPAGDGSRDSDGDGLTDRKEHELHTDPTCADTDGDGISDGVEEVIFHTSPVHEDTDGDGLSDGEETMLLETDPAIADPVRDLAMDEVSLLTRHVESRRSKAIAFAAFATDGQPQFYLRQESWGRHERWGTATMPDAHPGFFASAETGLCDVVVLPLFALREGIEVFARTESGSPAGTGGPVTNRTETAGAARWTNDAQGVVYYWGACTNVLSSSDPEVAPVTDIVPRQGEAGPPWISPAYVDEGGGQEAGFTRAADEENLAISWKIDTETEEGSEYTWHEFFRRNSEVFTRDQLVDLATNDLVREDPWNADGVPWGEGWEYDARGARRVLEGQVETAVLDVSSDEVECGARRLQYRVTIPESAVGVVYRASVLHFFTPKGSTNAQLIAHTNYLAVGTGEPMALNPDGTVLEAPAEEGTNWITTVRARLVPDFNRDGVIDDKDSRLLSKRGRFRFWINDDHDIGDDSDNAYDDAPPGSCPSLPSAIAARGLNCRSPKVAGLRDLVDYFPVYLDVPVQAFPPGEYTYRFRQADEAVRFGYTSLTPPTVGSMHKELVNGSGVDSDQPLHAADMSWSVPQTHAGEPPQAHGLGNTAVSAPIDAEWLASGRNVLLLEGTHATRQPLILEVCRDSQVVATFRLGLTISPVGEMFRYLNVRTCDVFFRNPDSSIFGDEEAVEGLWPTRLGEPPSYPDGFFNDENEELKTLVAIHGVNWDEGESPAGHAEIFKRFFQSGCNARFIGVSWASDIGRRFNLPMVFSLDLRGAFVAAPYVKEGLKGFCGSNTTLFVHSLGNILASSMIADHGLEVGNYFMVNAAVPIESFDGAPSDGKAMLMTHPDWKTDIAGVQTNRYPREYVAAHWHRLFSWFDPRSDVHWCDRFCGMTMRTHVYNFFSSEEDVLKQPNGNIPHMGLGPSLPVDGISFLLHKVLRTPRIPRPMNSVRDMEYVWVYSEMTKGACAVVSGVTVLRHVHAGWGFRIPNSVLEGIPPGGGLLGTSAERTAGSQPLPPYQLEQYDDLDPIQSPLFKPFEHEDAGCPLWKDALWLYAPDGAAVVEDRLPRYPISCTPGDTNGMNKLKNYAKLLAEAIPSLTGPAGGSALENVPSTDMGTECRIHTDETLWPKRANQGDKRNRWLHGDYKNPAYIYVHRLYDCCTVLLRGGTR